MYDIHSYQNHLNFDNQGKDDTKVSSGTNDFWKP